MLQKSAEIFGRHRNHYQHPQMILRMSEPSFHFQYQSPRFKQISYSASALNYMVHKPFYES
jgi:hypothetical protein